MGYILLFNPMLSLKFNANQSRNYLNELIKKVQNLTPALHEIGQLMVASTDENFQNEQNIYGVKWKQNTPATLHYKASRGFIMKVLQRRGMLRSSIQYRIEGDKVSVGTNLPYGAFHQYGTNRLPKREFLGVSRQDQKEIIAILEDYLG